VLREFLYEERYFATFLLVTVAIGGGAGWLTGRSMALTWRPWWKVVLATLLLGLGVRFIHFALFDAHFLSLHYYAVDTGFALVFALIGYHVTRSRQMAQQYGFLRSP
jgi:hypothetical protein